MTTRALAAGLVALVGCSAPSPEPAGARLGMNDVTFLVPLPGALDPPVLAALGDPGEPMISRGLFAAVVSARSDLAPKNGEAFGYDDVHVVALRFDPCARTAGPDCRDGEDGRLRLVLQPLYRSADGTTTLAHDIALHAFYPIPADELPGAIDELRALARIQGAPDAPLSVSPALAAAAPDPAYIARLRALIARYARWDRLVRLTVFGQSASSAAFAWIFRGVDLRDGALAPIEIADLGPGIVEQSVLLAGGDAIYSTTPAADRPRGLATALNGALFASAPGDERLVAVEALVEIQNPQLHGADDVQCVGCHVATFLTTRRAAAIGVDPSAVRNAFAAPVVDTIASRDGRVLRALGWAGSLPAISQRVANDTAQVLADIEQLHPAR